MDREIIGKGYISQLSDLEKIGFEKAEVSIKKEENLEKSFQRNIEIFSVHEFKGSFSIDGVRTWSNLGDNYILGDLSEKLIKKHIKFAKKRNIKRLVMHAGFVNSFVSNKEEALLTLARRLERVYDPQVKICIENSHFRPDMTAYETERLNVAPKDIKFLKEESDVPIHAVVDIEHLYATSLFKPFYNEFIESFREAKNEEEKERISKKAEEKMMSYYRNNQVTAKDRVDNFVENYFEVVEGNIEGIHICGSDYLNYESIENTQCLAGSHLPIGFEGKVKGREISDRVDYEMISRLTEAPFIIEVSSENISGNYLDWLKRSRENLEDILSRVE